MGKKIDEIIPWSATFVNKLRTRNNAEGSYQKAVIQKNKFQTKHGSLDATNAY